MDTPFQSHQTQDIVYQKHKSTVYGIANGVFKSFHFTKNWQQSRPELDKNLIDKVGELFIIKTSVALQHATILKYKTIFQPNIMKTVYGPVASWRLGKSLGVDLICSPKKICSFDCIYCQLEKTEKITSKRDTFVSINKVREEVKNAIEHTTPDVITFSGMGEPTLANNMHEAIETIRELTNIPLAILTNSSLLYDENVQKTLHSLDIIVAKLDAPNQELFQKISHPAEGITFEKTLSGIKAMKKKFHGKFALQIMFINENKNYANELAELSREIEPDEVQINTPLRPCAVPPLTKKELDNIEKSFTGLNTISVYHSAKPMADPLDKIELFKRRRMEL